MNETEPTRRWPITAEHRQRVVDLLRERIETATPREANQLMRTLLAMEEQNIADEIAGVSQDRVETGLAMLRRDGFMQN